MTKHMDNKEQIEEKSKKRVLYKVDKSDIAIIISFLGLLLYGYSTLSTVGKEKIDIRTYEFLGLSMRNDKIFIKSYFSFANFGKATGTISSIETFIRSIDEKNSEGNPLSYMRLFSDVFYESINSDIPFLGSFVYPKDRWGGDFKLYQKNTNGLGSFGSGKYECFIIFVGSKEEPIKKLHYEFNIEDFEVNSIIGNNMQYLKLTLLLEQERKQGLEDAYNSFKSPTADNNIGSDDDDLKLATKITVMFDPNGGIGGNDSQSFLAGRGELLDGGIPTRSGYKFLFWNSNPKGTGSYSWYNGRNTVPSSNITLYAVWEKVEK